MASEKTSARDSRLKNNNFLSLKSGRLARFEEELQQELNVKARAACAPVMKAFAECAKREGLLVVVKCRQENTEVNDCLRQYTNKDELDKLYEERIDAWKVEQRERAKRILEARKNDSE